MTALNKQAQQVRHWSRMASMTSERVSCVSVEQLDEIANALESADKRIAEQQSAIIAPGVMRCAGCGFVLTKNNINMTAGTITAGDSKTEPCPNGCGPLWPVTWKEQALQMRDDSESWFLELQNAKKRIAEHNFENRLLANADRDIKALRERIAELQAQTVCLPKLPVLGSNAEWYEGFAAGASGMRNECADAIRAAGIGVKGE